MPAQYGAEGPLHDGIVEGIVDRFEDHLPPDEREVHRTTFLDVHGGGKVPGDHHRQAAPDALYVSLQGHGASYTSIKPGVKPAGG